MMESLYQVTRRYGPMSNASRSRRSLRILTYLAPNLFWFYQFISRYLAKKLRYPTELSVGSGYSELLDQADIAFICGLPYVEHTPLGVPHFEPLVAPVLIGDRYGGKPIYFSDVIVQRDSPFRSFADLRGCSWAFNEPHSQSGYGITRYYLVQKRETNGYFGKVIEAGYHERTIHMVNSGEVDASAIDSHVLALMLRDNSTLASGLQVIDTFGPSPVQPIVVGGHLSKSLRVEMKKVLIDMSEDETVRFQLSRALVERFEPVSDSTYDDIRRMRATAEAAQFLTIR
jgi:phosphonate transport system substrate-binding protein